MGSAFAKTINALDEAAFQALYGHWDPPSPAQVSALLAGYGARWWIAGGRAARAGAAARQHDDTDIAVRLSDLDRLRGHLSGWHKAHLDRPKDRADLAAARLTPDARAWLAGTLDLLGQHDWAAAARDGG